MQTLVAAAVAEYANPTIESTMRDFVPRNDDIQQLTNTCFTNVIQDEKLFQTFFYTLNKHIFKYI